MTSGILVLAGLIVPLALDTFALGAALGIAGVPVDQRTRISLVLAAFEGAMPVVGLFVGRALGELIGNVAGWVAIAVLAGLGVAMLVFEDDDREARQLRLLAQARGPAIVGLGVAISLDELAVGFSLGLLGVSVLVAALWIGVQAFVAAQVGMRWGGALGEALRERAERLAAIALVVMAVVLAVIRVVHG